ncbi:MAG: hypothetical protein ACYTDW_20490, partial [Planctomycetota bacterium]
GIIVITMLPVGVYGASVVEWDFSKAAHGWTGNGRVENLRSSARGLIVKSTGEDPWIEGPAVDLPGDKMVRVKIRMKSTADPHAEIFYGKAFAAGRSLRFTVQNDGQWHNYSLIIKETLGPGTRFRLDPCTDKGELTVAFIKLERWKNPKNPTKQRAGSYRPNPENSNLSIMEKLGETLLSKWMARKWPRDTIPNCSAC